MRNPEEIATFHKEVAERFASTSERYGQAMYNVAMQRYELEEWFAPYRGTTTDPFYDNGNITRFLAWLYEYCGWV